MQNSHSLSRNSLISWLDVMMWGSVAIMLAIQIVLVVEYWNAPQFIDYGHYAELAELSYYNGSWYPTEKLLYAYFIFAPGFVNWLCLQLALFHSLAFNSVLNILINLGIMALIYKIAKQFFNISTAKISVIFYSWLYSTWWIAVPMATEAPFLLLALAGTMIPLSKRWEWCVVAGFLLAIANYIRPIAILFLITSIILITYTYRSAKPEIWKRVLSMIVGASAGIVIVGSISMHSCGRFIFQSSTFGINLIYTANDKAYGGVAASLLNTPGNACYIENPYSLTYEEKDSIWTSRAFEWIKENPGKYAALTLKKIPGMFAEDSWPDRAVLGSNGTVDAYMQHRIADAEMVKYMLRIMSKSIIYYAVLLLFLCSLWRHRKEIISPKGIWLLLLMMGIVATCIFAVSPRYHYPFMFIIVIWSAYFFTSPKRKAC